MTRKLAAVTLIAGLVLGGGGIAFAYFTGNGSGSGSATTGTISGADFTFTGSTSGDPLFPGGTGQDVTFTAHNSGGGSEYLATVEVTVATSGSGPTALAVDPETGPITGCYAAWYQLSESHVDYDTAVAGGATTDPISVGSVSMPTNSVDNQDLCQGHSIELDFTTAV